MLNESAIRLLQETAVNAAGAQELPIETAAPVVLLPDGNLRSLEHYQEGRYRFRASYSTRSLADFIAYVNARNDEAGPTHLYGKPVVFCEADQGEAVGIFNLGDVLKPGHGDDTALLTLKNTAGFAAMVAVLNKPFGQRALSEWLEDWADYLHPVWADGDESGGNLNRAIAAVRDITITQKSETNSQVRDMGASRGVMDEVEATSKLKLPIGFTFLCAPYENFESVVWRLRLAVLTDDKPKLVLRSIGFEDAQERVAKEFEQKVRAGVAEGTKVYRGSLSV